MSNSRFENLVDPFANDDVIQQPNNGNIGLVDPFEADGITLKGAGASASNDEGGMLDALKYGAQSTFNALGSTVDALQSDNQELVQGSENQSAIGQTAAQQAFRSDIASLQEVSDDSIWQGVKNVAQAAWDNPEGAFHETIGQLPNSGVVLGAMFAGGKAGALAGTALGPAGTAVGGTIGLIGGGLIGMFAGNFAVETGHIAQSKVKDGAVSDEEITQSLKEGGKKASVITTVDALTMGVSRYVLGAPGRAVEKAIAKTLTDEGIDIASDVAVRTAMASPMIKGRVAASAALAFEKATLMKPRVGMGATAFFGEVVSEGTGEYLGSKAAGLDASFTEAAMESLMSMPQSVTEMYVAKNLGTEGKLTKEFNAETTADESTLTPLEDIEMFDVAGELTPAELDEQELDAIGVFDMTTNGRPALVDPFAEPEGEQVESVRMSELSTNEQLNSPLNRLDETPQAAQQAEVDAAYADRNQEPSLPDEVQLQTDSAGNNIPLSAVIENRNIGDKTDELRQNLESRQIKSEADRLEAFIAQEKRTESDAQIQAINEQAPANPAMLDALASANQMAPEELRQKIINDEMARREVADMKRRQAANKKKPSKKVIDPDVDDIMTAIRKRGGLNIDSAVSNGIDRSHAKDKRGSSNPFRKNGYTMDDMATLLSEDGYFRPDEEVTDSVLVGKINTALSGKFVGTANGVVNNMQREIEDEMLMRAEDDKEAAAYLDAAIDMSDAPEGSAITDVAITDRADEAMQMGVPMEVVRDIINSSGGEVTPAIAAINKAIEDVKNLQSRNSETDASQKAESQKWQPEADDDLPGFDEESSYGPEKTDAEIDELFGITPTLSTYSESDLAAEVDVESKDAKEQIDRESELFDLGQNEDANVSMGATNDAAQQPQSTDLFSQPKAKPAPKTGQEKASQSKAKDEWLPGTKDSRWNLVEKAWEALAGKRAGGRIRGGSLVANQGADTAASIWELVYAGKTIDEAFEIAQEADDFGFEIFQDVMAQIDKAEKKKPVVKTVKKAKAVKAEKPAVKAETKPESKPSQETKPTGVPLNKIQIAGAETVTVKETGEVLELSQPADQVLRRLDKRIAVIKQLAECVG